MILGRKETQALSNLIADKLVSGSRAGLDDCLLSLKEKGGGKEKEKERGRGKQTKSSNRSELGTDSGGCISSSRNNKVTKVSSRSNANTSDYDEDIDTIVDLSGLKGKLFNDVDGGGSDLFRDGYDDFFRENEHTLEIDYDVLISYYNQIYVRKVAKKEVSSETMESFEKRRRKHGDNIMDMCKSSELSPYIVAKRWIERLERDGVINYNTVANFIDNIDSFPDAKLGKELLECIVEDHVLSHTSNQIKDVIGKVYEDHLIQKLVDRKMVFETENDLRNKGHSKTPDIHFLIPMGIKRSGSSFGGGGGGIGSGFGGYKAPSPLLGAQGSRPHSNSDIELSQGGGGGGGLFTSAFSRSGSGDSVMGDFDGSSNGNSSSRSSSRKLLLSPEASSPSQQSFFVVNWIDSKSMFADESTFDENSPQFEEYLSRYGRGLVIYWHGFTEGLAEKAANKWGPDMVLITDSFPEEWIFPSRELAGASSLDILEKERGL